MMALSASFLFVLLLYRCCVRGDSTVNIDHRDLVCPVSSSGPSLEEGSFSFRGLRVGEESSPSGSGSGEATVQNLGRHTGYIRLPHTRSAQMFYYFFESRVSKDDPVVIWVLGGPGCSTSGMFYANGPFRISSNLSLSWNDYGWDKVSNIIFVDSPTGTGFSYTNNESDYRKSSTDVSDDLYDFLQAFFTKHPDLVRNDFFITGASYAGHYIPALASRVNKCMI